MRGKLFLLASVCAGAVSFPAFAQSQPADAVEEAPIIVTAQRQSERLQDVPIAISAFSAEALDKQQIKNTSDLQLTLPNVTFTKTNFTSSSFTIRGIGDLCVGPTCDSATAIHINDAPQFGTRLFEGEFYDIAQIQVLRGPQGTLFGRNATSGVVDFITAKPNLNKIEAAGEFDYGNYDQRRIRAMVNLPISETLGVRLAGFYLKRDGYTLNTFDNSRIDDRDNYGIRGSIKWEPTSSTTINLMGQYFHERDSRLRIQKQLCQPDPTGVVGCLAATRPYGVTNGNSTFTGVLTSKQFFAARGLPTSLALGDLYGPSPFNTAVIPNDPRVVNSDFNPQYFTRETVIQGSIEQDLGGGLNLKVQGNYQDVLVDSSQDYNLSVQNRAIYQPAINTLAALAGGAGGPGLAAVLGPVAKALIPNGPNGVLCTSQPEPSGTGVFGGKSVCSMTPLDIDRSIQTQTAFSGEAILSSKWDGAFNFLLGGIYAENHIDENSYYVNAFSIDYFAGVVGALSTGGAGYLPPFFRNNTDDFKLKSYGLFGEAYYKFNDQFKLTAGLRYNNDKKSVTARSTLASAGCTGPCFVPFGSSSIFVPQFLNGFDADPGRIGNQQVQIRSTSSGEFTGRVVLDYQITPRNLLYMSYSRGYKSGGINPPLQAIFSVPETFKPEFVDAIEIGSKNQFGALTLNATAFYYKYKDLQLARIVSRTAVNDNVGANIYGMELEAIIRPVREFTVNANFSYLHTSVSQDKLLADPRDFTGGRSDAVLIKDITNGANCAVGANTAGNVAGVNAFVNTANNLINAGQIPGLTAGAGLRPTAPFPAGSGLNSTGAFSVCDVLTALQPTVGAAVGGVTVFSSGIPVNIKGNQLPGAPNYKASVGAQYELAVGGDITVTPRVDAIVTGESSGSIFNGNVNRVPSFSQFNAQVQIDGPDKKWYIRGYIQNISNSNAVTGLYVTDQSSGSFTNIFTLEPRRYGVAAGFRF